MSALHTGSRLTQLTPPHLLTLPRSWKMAGVAARSAIALGLNQRAIGDQINASS
jgi:hypothetical protein